MTEKTEEQPNVPEKKLYAESRGKYILIDGVKSFSFDFPAQCSIEENYAAIFFLKDAIFKVIQEKEEKAKEENKKESEIETKT